MPPEVAKKTTMVKQTNEDINTEYVSQLVNHGYPADNQIGINEMGTGYIQKNDTMGDSDMWQQLRLEAVSTDFDENEAIDTEEHHIDKLCDMVMEGKIPDAKSQIAILMVKRLIEEGEFDDYLMSSAL